MPLMSKPQTLKWPQTYWVQPGEVAVLVDGGKTVDPDGTPNVFRQGDQVRARLRLFSGGRKQQLFLFDAKRQGQPITLELEVFQMGEFTVTLSADIYYRISNPLPLLETVHLDNAQEIETAVRGRVLHLIARLIQQRPFAFFLGMHDTIRDLLLNNLWLAENDLILEDVIVYSLVPPPQITEARAALIARLGRYGDRVHALLEQGIDPTFAYVQEHEPALAQHILARTAEQYQQFVPRPGSTEAGHDLALVARDAWDGVVSAAQSDMDETGASADSSGWARDIGADSSLAPQTEPTPDSAVGARPAVAPIPVLDPVPVSVQATAPPHATTPEPLAPIDPEHITAEVSRIADVGYFVRRVGMDAISVQLPDRTVHFQLPGGFPNSAPAMTIVGSDGTSVPARVEWASDRHLVDLLPSASAEDMDSPQP